jgi:hypothetical protein
MIQIGTGIGSGGGQSGGGDSKFYSQILLFFTTNSIKCMTTKTEYCITNTSNRLHLRGSIATYTGQQNNSNKRKHANGERRKTRSRIQIDDDRDSKSTTSTSKCIQIDEKTLHPVKGRLSCRLTTAIQHFPQVPAAKMPRCQLHR